MSLTTDGQNDERMARDAVEAAAALADTDPGRALELLAQAVTPSLRRIDPTLTARASYLRAQLLSGRGDYDAALHAIRSARRDWLASGDALAALRTDLGRATVLHELGEYRTAIEISTKLLDQLGTLATDVTRMREVSSISASAHNNLGNCWSRLGDLESGLRHYDLASNLFHALGETVMQAKLDANRGLAYLRRGLAHRALDELRRAQEALIVEGNRLAAAKCGIDLAEAHLQLDEVPMAIEVLGRTRTMLVELEAVPELARLGVMLGHALLRADCAAAAREEAREAADIFADLSMTDESGRATYLSGLASHVLGEEEEAAAELAAAERLFAHCGDIGHLARVQLAQAQLAELGGDLEEARRLVGLALESLAGSDDRVPRTMGLLALARLSQDPVEADELLAEVAREVALLGLTPLMLMLDLENARQDRRRGRLEDAISRLRSALTAELRRSGSLAGADAELWIALHGASAKGYDELIVMLLELGTVRAVTEAWQWSTYARSRALAHHLARELPSEVAPTDLTVPEGPLLQYHVVDSDLVAFVIREGQVHVRRIVGATPKVRYLVRLWRLECTRLGSGSRDLVGADGAAELGIVDRLLADLHELLVDPVEELLEDLYGQPLLVLAHHDLHGVPFEALKGSGESLSRRYSLVFAPGLAVAPQTIAGDAEAGSTLVVAVPDEKAPSIAVEAGLVAELRPGADLLLGPAATASSLRAAIGGREVVHVACHGWHRPADPMSSGLLLADGWLTAAQIAELDLDGALVVLTACGAGEVSVAGVEPMGLVWAFLAAGARGVIASGWAVEDDVAVALMRSLYQHLASGVSPRDALDAARADLALRHRHPYYWASFRLTHSPSNALMEGLAL